MAADTVSSRNDAPSSIRPPERVGQRTVTCEFPPRLGDTLGAAGVDEAPPSLSAEERFTLDREIGRGGMGVVYAARDNVLRRSTAMKVLSRKHARRVMARFFEEAQITSQLDHPHIVPVHDLGVSDEGRSLYFTMKLVEGTTLADYFAELHGEPLTAPSLERVLRLFLKVCEAVAFAHSRGVVHRDLKPDNIMVGTHGQVYVMDWGIALLREGDRISTEVDDSGEVLTDRGGRDAEGTIIGTPTHMAPEQARGDIAAIDERTDVYGLGSVLYELLTGQGPHGGLAPHETLMRARSGEVAPPTEYAVWPALPPELCRITMKALAADPADRYPSVEALSSDVEAFLRGGRWFEERSFRAGSVVVTEGDEAHDAFVIVSGECEAYKTIHGERRSLRRMGPGDVFGEVAVLGQTRRSASVVALTDVTAKVITADSLDRELQNNPWLLRFVKTLSERFLEADRRLDGRRG